MNIIEKVKKALDNYTAYELSKVAGVRPHALQKYKNGDAEIKNMRLGTALEIVKYVEERENMKKLYLNEVLPNELGFDVSELSNAWEQDENGYYTCDEEEYQWFEKLSRAYDLKEEYNIELDDRYINDWDDYIRQIEEKVTEIECGE